MSPSTSHRPADKIASPVPVASVTATTARAERLRTNIRCLVAARGLTLAEIARKGGLPSANAIHNFLGGRSFSLSLATLQALAKVLDVSVDDLIGPSGCQLNGHANYHPDDRNAPGQPPIGTATGDAFARLAASLEAVSFVLEAASRAAAEASQAAKVRARPD